MISDNTLENDYENFKKEIYKLIYIDLNCYKEKQMKRRIDTLLNKKGIPNYEKYIERLKSNDRELKYFTDYITINVTEFFRDSEYWEFLKNKIIPDLIKSKDKKLRIWSSACSTGEEPYSIAMLLLDYLSPDQFEIIATDIDERVLEKAQLGLYTEQTMELVSEGYKSKYFTQAGAYYQLSEEIKKCVEFKKLNLHSNTYPENLDLIVCRNVLIYFTEETKNRMFYQFLKSLRTNGCLFLGQTEQIVYYKNIGYQKLTKSFYKKIK